MLLLNLAFLGIVSPYRNNFAEATIAMAFPYIGSENPDKKLQNYDCNRKGNDMDGLNLNLALVLIVIPHKPAL